MLNFCLCRLWSAVPGAAGERNKPCYLRLYHGLGEAVAVAAVLHLGKMMPGHALGGCKGLVPEVLMLRNADSHPSRACPAP